MLHVTTVYMLNFLLWRPVPIIHNSQSSSLSDSKIWRLATFLRGKSSSESDSLWLWDGLSTDISTSEPDLYPDKLRWVDDLVLFNGASESESESSLVSFVFETDDFLLIGRSSSESESSAALLALDLEDDLLVEGRSSSESDESILDVAFCEVDALAADLEDGRLPSSESDSRAAALFTVLDFDDDLFFLERSFSLSESNSESSLDAGLFVLRGSSPSESESLLKDAGLLKLWRLPFCDGLLDPWESESKVKKHALLLFWLLHLHFTHIPLLPGCIFEHSS